MLAYTWIHTKSDVSDSFWWIQRHRRKSLGMDPIALLTSIWSMKMIKNHSFVLLLTIILTKSWIITNHLESTILHMGVPLMVVPKMDGLGWKIPPINGWWTGVGPFQETSTLFLYRRLYEKQTILLKYHHHFQQPFSSISPHFNGYSKNGGAQAISGHILGVYPLHRPYIW